MTRELFLYSKTDCPLCDSFKTELDNHNIQHHVIMIDNDLELKQRYGARVPVLEAGSIVVCEAQFQQELIKKFMNIST